MLILTECNLAKLVVEILAGKTAVFPTETSYGLGCDAANQAAVDKIFKIKGRASDKPLLVVVPSIEMAKEYLVWNETLEKIAGKYWPGALTVVGEALSQPPAQQAVSITPPPPQRRGQGEEIAQLRRFSFEKIIGSIETLGYRREMRQNPTKAEKILWQNLRNKKLGGIKFHRQHGIGPFIVDFYQADSRTVIEVDGDIHFVEDKNLQQDKDRQRWLEKNGYRVLRYNNVDIFNNLEWILEEIHNTMVSQSSPFPLRCGGGGSDAQPPPSPLWRGGGLANGVVSATNTIALRVTAHPLLKSITEKLGRPLVATSANISDAGDAYEASAVIKQFAKRKVQPDIFLNQGSLPPQKPTTIVLVVGNQSTILRQGALKIVV